MTEVHKYTMTVDLAIIESLGINLYSNAAAVLSELVANAYDADATLVQIEWNAAEQEGTVTVVDDGCGMTVAEINDRFLVTGYKKRQTEGEYSIRWKRPFMGRKGIGKLSVFSIAKEVLIYSTKNQHSNGLCINIDDLEQRIKAKEPYHPKPVPVPDEFASPGTAIVLNQLKSKRVALTVSALRKRLARRFDVVDQTPRSEGGFKIQINGEDVTYADRQELRRLEYIWEFGRQSLPSEALPSDIVRYTLPADIPHPEKDWSISGWIGTARVPSDLTADKEAGSLKNIIVLARKRPIQEGIIDKLDFSRVFGNYVTGQIEADFLDQEGEDDIATSDRQRLIEDDPRVQALQQFLRDAFAKASETWNRERPKRKARAAIADKPQLRKWVEGLPPWQRESAEKLIGTIAALPMEKGSEDVHRSELYRAGILAFARIGLRKTSDDLNSLSNLNAEELLTLLGAQDEYESALWIDIFRSRVQAIQQFENLTDTDEKEKVLRNHLFDHLWLLDASWERATADPKMEEDLRRIDPDLLAVDAEGNEIRGRMDLRFAKATGVQIIVELKRYSRKMKVEDLVSQGRKYRAAVESILTQQGEKFPRIEVAFVIGSRPRVSDLGVFKTDHEAIEYALYPIAGRYLLYDELIANACRQYDDYFSASRAARELDEVLNSLIPNES